MTSASSEGGADPQVYSKDYWDQVFEQVGRRPLVKFAIVVLALLYGSAVYAPFIANDRPFVLEAVNYGEYAKAQKTLYGVAITVQGLVKKGEAGFLEGLTDTSTIRDYREALDIEIGALETRLTTMRSYLDEGQGTGLDELEQVLSDAVAAALDGREEEATELASELRTKAKEVRTSYKPVDLEDPESEGMALSGTTSYPIFESTTSVEIFFMVLWALLLSWPLWNWITNRLVLRGDRTRIRKTRRLKTGIVLVTSLAASLIWASTVGGEMAFESAIYKNSLTNGEILATRAEFPPLSMGFAENRLAEAIRPPTWSSNAELDENGYYVRGPLKIEPDPETGDMPPPRTVEVLEYEPELNSPWRHVLGTDRMGRDLLARILYGGRISLLVGILSTILLVLIGVVMGSVAGYFGGWVDIVISRLIEMFQAVPAFFLILVAVAMIPEETIHPMFAIVFFIAVVRWTGVARLVRGEFLRLKEQEFVIAAQALGFSNRRVIFRHVLPNALGPVLVAAAFSVASGILTESSISFLGLGVQHPTPSWGSLLNEAKGAVEFWWLQIFPGFLIFVTVFCYNVVGEGVRDALDPRRKV